MKYLTDPSLEALSRSLSHSSPECTVHTRVEAYSSKTVTKDKKLWKHIDEHYADEAPELLDSPFGSLDTVAARRMFCLLIGTLNSAFPDHDFSEVSPDHFRKEADGGVSVLTALSATLNNLRVGDGARPLSSRTYGSFPTSSGEFLPSPLNSSSPLRSMSSSTFDKAHSPDSSTIHSLVVANTHPTLFRILNDVLPLAECDVYSYSPDVYSDPHGDDYSDEEDGDSASDGEYHDDDEGYDSDRYSDVESNEYWDDGTNVHYDPYQSSTRSHRRRRFGSVTPWDPSTFDDDDADLSYSSSSSPSDPRRRMIRKRGALLWSNYYFFFHKKEKKIIFITSWARRAPTIFMASKDEETWPIPSGVKEKDSFLGWEGAVGAGARAFVMGTERVSARA